jgi:hypothetical protein
MLDIKKILSRSWHILWAYRLLWVFGFILALTSGANNFGNQSNYSVNDGQRNPSSEYQYRDGWDDLEADSFPEFVEEVSREISREFRALQEEYPVEYSMGISAAITFFVMIFLVGIVMAVLRYVAEAASIRMVDEYEESEIKVGFRQAWKYGWNRGAWRLFLVNFIVNLPGLVLFVILGLVGWWFFSVLMGGVEWEIINSIIAGSGIAFLSILITVILMTVLYILRDFAWRMVVLEGAGVREGLRGAWGLLKRQWKNIGLMWLVVVGLKIAWAFAFIILIFPLLIVSLITAMGGAVAALIPSLITAGIASLLSAPDYWPWIFAAIIGAPIFFVVTFSPMFLVGGWGETYKSSVWTLTYRELKTLELVTPEGDTLELENGEVEEEDETSSE